MVDKVKDGDVCPEYELSQYFNSSCSKLFSKQISDENYILHISGMPSRDSNVAIGCSGSVVQLYNISNNSLILSETFETENSVIGVKVCPENENIFYIGRNNCEVQIWDTRHNCVVNVFKDSTAEVGEERKTLNCFDVSSNNLLISGGTDLCGCDSFIMFWDVRKCNLMGAYWESHTDDITQVAFNPSNMNQLISSSTDGLINIYDLSQSCEDDALTDTLNTSSSPDTLVWYRNGNSYGICCISHTNLQLWKLDGVAPHSIFNRRDLVEPMKRKIEDDIYIADAYVNIHGHLNILCGSSYNCLRGFSFVNDKVMPNYNFQENRQRVRCCWYNHNENILLTGGENGTLDLWSLEGTKHLNGIYN